MCKSILDYVSYCKYFIFKVIIKSTKFEVAVVFISSLLIMNLGCEMSEIWLVSGDLLLLVVAELEVVLQLSRVVVLGGKLVVLTVELHLLFRLKVVVTTFFPRKNWAWHTHHPFTTLFVTLVSNINIICFCFISEFTYSLYVPNTVLLLIWSV
jgi:hypothetical protein